MAEISVFELKLQFLAWMFLIETHEDHNKLYRKYAEKYFKELDWNPWDTDDTLYRLNGICWVDDESRHLHQCPRGKLIYDWWFVNRTERRLNGEMMSDGRFVEMVGIIKKTIHKSQTLEMLVGGWQHSREQ
jgi:hypothetical protein